MNQAPQRNVIHKRSARGLVRDAEFDIAAQSRKRLLFWTFLALMLVLLGACEKNKGSDSIADPERNQASPTTPRSVSERKDSTGKEVSIGRFLGGEFVTPAKGKYIYKVTSTSKEGDKSSKDVEFRVFGPRQVSTGVFEQETQRGAPSAAQKQVWIWKDAGVFAASDSWVFSATESPPCLLEPSLLVLKLPIRQGDSWGGEAHCRDQQREGQRIGAEVLRAEKLSIANLTLDTWVIQESWIREFDNQVPGPTSAADEGVYWYSSILGIRIKAERKSSDSSGKSAVITEEITSIPVEAQNRLS